MATLRTNRHKETAIARKEKTVDFTGENAGNTENNAKQDEKTRTKENKTIDMAGDVLRRVADRGSARLPPSRHLPDSSGTARDA